MVDWVKKVNKSCSDTLGSGESFVAATYVEPPGVVGRTVALGAVGGAIGLALANSQAKKQAEAAEAAGSTTGIADELPKHKGVVALTEQRLLMFSHSAMSGRPKDLVFETPRETIQAVEFQMGKLLGKIQIAFTDGSAVQFESAKIGKPADFAAALGAQT